MFSLERGMDRRPAGRPIAYSASCIFHTTGFPLEKRRWRGCARRSWHSTGSKRCYGVKELELTAADSRSSPVFPDGLTNREVEVLRLIAAGLTNKEIGEKLFISTKTVNTHVRNILEKVGASNRAEASVYAMRNGLVEE